MAHPSDVPSYHQPSLFGQAAGPREPRFAYPGTVRLIVTFDPWRLIITLTGKDLSVTGLAATWKPAQKGGARPPGTASGAPGAAGGGGLGAARVLASQAQKAHDEVAALFVEGDPYDLQLEHDAHHLPAPFLRARLVRARRVPGGLDLAFAFEAPDTDLLSLVHELADRS